MLEEGSIEADVKQVLMRGRQAAKQFLDEPTAAT